MEKLIESIWNAAVLYCNKINEVALHPNDNPDDLRPVSAPSEYRNIITRFENKVIKYSREMDYCRKCRNIERRKKNQKGE